MMKNKLLKTIAVSLVSIMLFAAMALPSGAVTGDFETSELEDMTLLNALGMKVHTVLGNGISDAHIDNSGRLVVTAGTQANQNVYIGANIDDIAGQLTNFTLETKLTGIVMDNGWHYGIGWNNAVLKTAKCYYTMRAGEYGATATTGQLLCFGVNVGNNANYMGNGTFAGFSAANGTDNIFSVTVSYDEATGISSYIFKMNGITVWESSETYNASLISSNFHYLNDFNIVIPQGKQVAISYMKVLDGNGNVVYDEDFSAYSAKTSAISEYGLKISDTGNAIGLTGVKEAYVNYNDELILTSYGPKNNAYVEFPLNDAAKALEDYTLEATIKGINVVDGYHYGISWNTQISGRAYFTMRSGTYTEGKNFGELLCFPTTGGVNAKYLGKDIDGSAAVGNANTFKVVVAKTGTVSFYMNGNLVTTLTSAEATLSNFSIVVPYGQSVAVDEVAVYDVNGNTVYFEDFKDASSYVGTSVRIDEFSGIRVKSAISAELTSATIAKDGFKVVEYGTLVAKAENYKTAAMTVGATGVQKAIAYNATTDTYFERNENETIYTIVLHNIANANTEYAFRAYYVVEYADGTTETFYQTYNGSYNLVKSLYSVAEQIAADPNATEAEINYANTILGK